MILTILTAIVLVCVLVAIWLDTKQPQKVWYEPIQQDECLNDYLMRIGYMTTEERERIRAYVEDDDYPFMNVRK
jgi:hypothetical protein